VKQLAKREGRKDSRVRYQKKKHARFGFGTSTSEKKINRFLTFVPKIESVGRKAETLFSTLNPVALATSLPRHGDGDPASIGHALNV